MVGVTENSETPEDQRPAPGAATVTVILNPAAGRGQGAARRPEIERLLTAACARSAASDAWAVVETTAPGSAVVQAAKAANCGSRVVAAAGGDGTYSDVVNGLVGTGARLGIVPLGTGNDFARMFGLVGDLPTAIDALFFGTPRPIDLGAVSSWASRPDPNSQVRNRNSRWFINVAGCGFDAVAAERANRGYRWLRGTAAYTAAVVGSLLNYRPAHMTITVDGQTLVLAAMLCSIANSRTYGGGMRIAPEAEIDDGWLDLCLLRETSKLEFLLSFPRVFKGTHISHPKVTMLRGRNIRVESDPPMPVLVDGEVLGVTPADFTLHHHAIEVMTPAQGSG